MTEQNAFVSVNGSPAIRAGGIPTPSAATGSVATPSADPRDPQRVSEFGPPRNRTAAWWRAAALTAVNAILLLTFLVIALLRDLPNEAAGWSALVGLVPCLLLAPLLVSRLPGTAVTRLITAFSLSIVLTMAIESIAWSGTARSDLPHAPLPPVVAAFTSALWLGTLPLIPILMVVFPDGVPRKGIWRAVFYAQLIALALAVPGMIDQADGTMAGPLSVIATIAGFTLLLSGVVRAVTLILMWWRAKGARRRQLSLFVTATAGLLLVYLISGLHLWITGASDFGNPWADGAIFAYVTGCLPAAIAASVLRDRLFGIEIALNRVAVGAVLSFLLLAVYAAATAVVSVIFGTRGPTWPAFVVTGITIVTLAPLYRLASSAVNRIMFGDRQRPDRALRALSSNLGQTIDPLDLPQTIANSVATALRIPFVEISRPVDGQPTVIASVGASVISHRLATFPITFGGETLAALAVAPRTGEDTLTSVDRALLSDLAAQAGPAMYAGRLIDELADSRERLRQGRLEERSTLRGALHDSLSPSLSGIALAAAAARVKSTGDPDVRALLAGIEAEATRGAATLRALLAGLQPPGLDDLGLAGAIEQRARELSRAAGTTFHVRSAQPVPALGPQVEQTVYLAAVEAMVNVARHARAEHCDVVLATVDGALTLDVIDDGMGLTDRERSGHGLTSARQRIEAHGGRLELSSLTAGGTRFRATLPVWTSA